MKNPTKPNGLRALEIFRTADQSPPLSPTVITSADRLQDIAERLRAHGVESDLHDYPQVETAIAELVHRAYTAGFHDGRKAVQ